MFDLASWRKILRPVFLPLWTFINSIYFLWLIFIGLMFIPTLDPFNSLSKDGAPPVSLLYISSLVLCIAITIGYIVNWHGALFDYRNDFPIGIIAISLSSLGLVVSLCTIAVSFWCAGYLNYLGLLIGSLVIFGFVMRDVIKEGDL